MKKPVQENVQRNIFYLSFVISVLTGVFLSDDKNESIFLVAVSVAAVVIIVKLKYILCEQEDITKFIQNTGTHLLEDEVYFLQITKKINFLMKFATFFTCTTFVGITPLFILYLPIFSVEKRLPLNIGFPFDWRTSEIAYWIAYFYTIFNFMITIFCLLLNVIIWYLMINCAIKYETLGNQFRGVSKTKATGERDKNISDAVMSFTEKLIDLIKNHRNLQE